MPASPFTITPTSPTSLKLEVGEDGTFAFTVTSLAAPDSSQELVCEALWIGPDGKGKSVDWLVVGPSRSLMLKGGDTATVTIGAKPRTTTPRGEHKIQLAIADNERLHDVFGYSEPVSCEVTARPVVTPPPPKRFPRWLIAVIAGGAVVVGVNIFLLVKLLGRDGDDASLGRRCDAQTPCDAGLICADVGKCLQPGRGACKEDGACASGECVSLGVCAVPIGLTCRPGDKVPCSRQAVCHPRTNTCLGGAGAPCTTGAQCESGQCAGGVCTADPGGSFVVVLRNSGTNKLGVIKVVRELTGLGLKEAKDLVDGAPKEVKSGITKAEAADIGRRLQEVGAEVEIGEVR
jgi:large subunit ribosomal protein L7/L12